MQYSKSESLVPGASVVEEWALINKYKGQEDQKMKQIQKQQQHQKMIRFREGLNQQIHSKLDQKKIEKDMDNSYYKYVLSREQELTDREEKDKKQRASKRKQIQLQNSLTTEQLMNSRSRMANNEYKLEIGVQSDKDQKLREQRGKKQMVRGLESQLREKSSQNKNKKIEEYYMDIAHQRNQLQQFDRHTIVKTKQYKQNENVYNYYKRVFDERRRKNEELEKKYVDEAAQRQVENEVKRKRSEEKKKIDLSQNMQDTLAQQVKFHNYKKHGQRISNPEESSFEFMNDVYKEKLPIVYDKNKYYKDLKVQAQEQKAYKKKQSLMSEEEYKFNRNQLNKIVNGEYAHSNYVDRSLGAIGENKKVTNSLSKIDDPNSAFVWNRLKGIRTRNDDYISRLENSYN